MINETDRYFFGSSNIILEKHSIWFVLFSSDNLSLFIVQGGQIGGVFGFCLSRFRIYFLKLLKSTRTL